eukprot:TRINITY_DN5945_c0_g1_i1.p1 TRINITY_DN5945_c0_g1~~TRINITY_DN5945_c0_g1_i1.p1  ORF type:complete len:320 (-),score=32.30 TRINITY_DN5945_c0_g1_i1:27-986(-)
MKGLMVENQGLSPNHPGIVLESSWNICKFVSGSVCRCLGLIEIDLVIVFAYGTKALQNERTDEQQHRGKLEPCCRDLQATCLGTYRPTRWRCCCRRRGQERAGTSTLIGPMPRRLASADFLLHLPHPSPLLSPQCGSFCVSPEYCRGSERLRAKRRLLSIQPARTRSPQDAPSGVRGVIAAQIFDIKRLPNLPRAMQNWDAPEVVDIWEKGEIPLSRLTALSKSQSVISSLRELSSLGNFVLTSRAKSFQSITSCSLPWQRLMLTWSDISGSPSASTASGWREGCRCSSWQSIIPEVLGVLPCSHRFEMPAPRSTRQDR